MCGFILPAQSPMFVGAFYFGSIFKYTQTQQLFGRGSGDMLKYFKEGMCAKHKIKQKKQRQSFACMSLNSSQATGFQAKHPTTLLQQYLEIMEKCQKSSESSVM